MGYKRLMDKPKPDRDNYKDVPKKRYPVVDRSRRSDDKQLPYKDRTGQGQSRAMAARNAAIKSNQGTISSRNMAVDAGKPAYVRGKNAGLVAVPKVMVRSVNPRDDGMERRRRQIPNPSRGERGMPRPTRPRKPGDRRA